MENPLGLLRSQIYRLFNPKSKKVHIPDGAGPTLHALKADFPWASDEELELIKKEKLYLDADFIGDHANFKRQM